MPTTLDLTGLNTIVARLRSLENLDANDLMIQFELIIQNDNMRGVMAGLDKDGQPMAPATYRPKSAIVTQLGPKAAPMHPGYHRRGIHSGRGPMQTGWNNNLTSSEYRVLAGPPLAPRGKNSRVITNLYTEHQPQHTSPDGRWVAIGAWRDVVSNTGEPFLRYHFDGEGRLPQRDLRGVRPEGMAEAQAATEEWIMGKINAK